jgi:C4-dicarboxylate transporter
MIILGVVLVIVGAAILYFFSPERFAQFGGAVLLLIGVLLVLLGVLDTADVNLD